MKLPRTLRLRGETNQCASDTLADSRVQKPKNFLAFFSRLLPPPLRREAEKGMERGFWFCFAVSVSEKSNHIITFLFALFSALTATEAHPYLRLVVTLNSKTCLRAVITQKIWIVLRHKQICMCLTHPPIRAQIPAVFRKYYKTAGIAPQELFVTY